MKRIFLSYYIAVIQWFLVFLLLLYEREYQ